MDSEPKEKSYSSISIEDGVRRNTYLPFKVTLTYMFQRVVLFQVISNYNDTRRCVQWKVQLFFWLYNPLFGSYEIRSRRIVDLVSGHCIDLKDDIISF